MADETKRAVEKSVSKLMEKLKTDGNSRFSKGDFQGLVYAVLSDPEFQAKKYLLKVNEIIETEFCINDGMRKFLDKLLKHAGLSDAAERDKVIDSFEYGARDVEWVTDAVDEAMNIYCNDCGKNMRMFRNAMLQLAVKRIVRTGKFDGKPSYKKSVIDLQANLEKSKKKK